MAATRKTHCEEMPCGVGPGRGVFEKSAKPVASPNSASVPAKLRCVHWAHTGRGCYKARRSGMKTEMCGYVLAATPSLEKRVALLADADVRNENVLGRAWFSASGQLQVRVSAERFLAFRQRAFSTTPRRSAPRAVPARNKTEKTTGTATSGELAALWRVRLAVEGKTDAEYTPPISRTLGL